MRLQSLKQTLGARDWRARHRPRDGAPSVRSAVVHFSIVGLAAIVVLGFGSAAVLRRDTTRQAVRNAQALGEFMGSSVVEPALGSGILTSSPLTRDRLDQLVQDRLRPAGVVRVKVWKTDGSIIYSDEHRLIGRRYPLDRADLATVATGRPAADLSDLSAPENILERGHGKLLQVYTRVRAQDGTPLLFEVYFPFRSVSASGGRLWREIGPVVIGALLLLGLAQLPAAYYMARGLRQAHRRREALLVRAIDASEVERRTIAANLHDGVVQQLTAVSYTLAMTADSDLARGDDDVRSQLAQASAGTQDSIRQLRTLLVDLYPASVRYAGLPSAIDQMLGPLRARGIKVTFAADYGQRLATETETLVFRVAQESLRNVASHARATSLSVSLHQRADAVDLRVVDDGTGFDVGGLIAPAVRGHVGLRLLHDLVASAGGKLAITSSPGGGTAVVLDLPAGRASSTVVGRRAWRPPTAARQAQADRTTPVSASETIPAGRTTEA